ncbi:MAG: two-component sensor histidine kinase, partial [Candidatus Eisenbacteria bacterium]|nr:two-component sensor histidine kinase [Candidatus Eisenbacteria bacterium]
TETYYESSVEALEHRAERLHTELARWERLAAVGSMAAKVAHEIRNPLSAISLNAELLQDEVAELPPGRRSEGRRLLGSILGQVDRLNALIEEYLAFARLPRAELCNVSVPRVLEKLEHLLQGELRVRGIEMTMSVDAGVPEIASDPRQLEQVLLNLLKNSIEAMPDGGRIAVVAEARGDIVEVRIKDTGCGIREEHRAEIFDPLFTTKDGGTGLGLSFVQQALRELQGRVEFTSTAGAGTEFVLHFPAASSEAAGVDQEE